jgi:SOS-response transcriptional repressor LexA
MSFQAMAWAAAQKTGSPARKALLLAIANYADEDGVCWPSRETLAEDSEQSVDSVDRHIKELETSGFIKRSSRPGRRADGGEQSKLITIQFSRERLKNDLASNRRHAHKSLGPQPHRAGELSRNLRP